MESNTIRAGRGGKIRYAVVGLGRIAQSAVLPAFRQAADHSTLAALVSSDPEKLQRLARRYQTPATYAYDQFDDCLQNEEVNAVFIALPNHLHCEYAVRAAERGRHVLCEKPMAITEDECRRMIQAASDNDVRLMIGYRLHLEAANLDAVELVRSGQLGEPRFFQSSLSMQVGESDIRVRRETGGGTLYDLGVYCINAARYLFGDEPQEVSALCARGHDPRFAETDEMTSAILRFPGERLASFTCSFGAAPLSNYRVVGTEGELRLEPAYDYSGRLVSYLTRDGRTSRQMFPKRDQFAAELSYFSKCVLEGVAPEPSGLEGLADVRIIQALYRSADEGRTIAIEAVPKISRPTREQEIHFPPSAPAELVNTQSLDR